ADDAQVGTGVRLGQAHGTGPDAGVHVRQVGLLELFAGVCVDRQAGTGGQHRIQAEGQVGRVQHFLDLGAQHLRHAHAAIDRITADADPATFAVDLVGFGETARSGHHAVLPLALFLVTAAVQ